MYLFSYHLLPRYNHGFIVVLGKIPLYQDALKAHYLQR